MTVPAVSTQEGKKMYQRLPSMGDSDGIVEIVEGKGGADLWFPIPDSPQEEAYYCEADELFFGGAAGGGKTDLLIGMALTTHRNSIIFRREFTQIQELMRRSREIIEDRGRLNEQIHVWRDLPGGRRLEFGGVKQAKDVNKWKGRPHDLKSFDEITEFTESQYRFLTAWLRTSHLQQRTRIVVTGNPPTTSEGEWVIRYWSPWLDDEHPNPAQPGELRWYAMIDGEETEVENGDPFTHDDEVIQPRSRTFIPAFVEDNPYLMATEYKTILQGLPEPLRSQLLKGDFQTQKDINPWQVIPTEWVRLAQKRWEEREPPDTPITTVGVDVARGGKDKTVLAPRQDEYFGELRKYPGVVTDDGQKVATLIMSLIKDEEEPPEINVDAINVGTSVVDVLKDNIDTVHPVNVAAGTRLRDKTRRYKFRNIRAAAYWTFRESLDPDTGDDVALPPDRELLVDLCAPQYKVGIGGIQIEPKDDIKERLGRSPDCGDAVVLAAWHEIRIVKGYGGSV